MRSLGKAIVRFLWLDVYLAAGTDSGEIVAAS